MALSSARDGRMPTAPRPRRPPAPHLSARQSRDHRTTPRLGSATPRDGSDDSEVETGRPVQRAAPSQRSGVGSSACRSPPHDSGCGPDADSFMGGTLLTKSGGTVKMLPLPFPRPSPPWTGGRTTSGIGPGSKAPRARGATVPRCHEGAGGRGRSAARSPQGRGGSGSGPGRRDG